MRYFICCLIVSASFAQEPAPPLEGIRVGSIVVIARSGQEVERRVAATPENKLLSQDSNFVLRAAAGWTVWFYSENTPEAVCWLRGEQPATPVQMKSDLVPADILLEVPLSDYRAAPALGDSLYFLHADPRTKLVDGVQLIQEDSREWGPVHAREFLRIVAPEPDE